MALSDQEYADLSARLTRLERAVAALARESALPSAAHAEASPTASAQEPPHQERQAYIPLVPQNPAISPPRFTPPAISLPFFKRFDAATRLILLLGSILVLAGVGYFLALLVKQGLLGPAARCTLGFLGGAALFIQGARSYHNVSQHFGRMLLGTGLGIGYLSLWFATAHYHFFSPLVGVGALSIMAGLAAVFAWHLEDEVVFILSLVGLIIAPPILSLEISDTYFLYASIIFIGSAHLGLSRTWPRLASLSASSWFSLSFFVKSAALVPLELFLLVVILGSSSFMYRSFAKPQHFVVTAIAWLGGLALLATIVPAPGFSFFLLACVLASIVWAVTPLNFLRRLNLASFQAKPESMSLSALWALLTPVALSFLLPYLLSLLWPIKESRNVLAIALSVLLVLLAQYLRAHLFLLAALVPLLLHLITSTLLLPVQLLAATAVTFYILYYFRAADSLYKKCALVLGLGSFVIIYLIYLQELSPALPFINLWTLAMVLSSIPYLVFLSRAPRFLPGSKELVAIAWLAVLGVLFIDFTRQFYQLGLRLSPSWGHLAVSFWWLALAAISLVLAIRSHSPKFRLAALLLASVTGVKVLLLDLGSSPLPVRVAAALVVGLGLLALARYHLTHKTSPPKN